MSSTTTPAEGPATTQGDAPRPEIVTAASVRKAKSSYRADIQGLRGVASLLVAIFHTWIGTVSGGVDVFFVLTGMLMTATLVGNVRRTGGVDFRRYVTRLAGRLLPLAGLVLVAVTVLVLVAFPRFQWADQFGDIFASATYWQNWHLAAQSTDYLAQGTTKSPVQHYWAMSVQGQFYLIWAAVIALAAWLARVLPRWSLARWIVTLVVIVSIASGIWAIVGVLSNPVYVYYDTWARLWEFGVGSILFIAMRGRELSSRWRAVLGVVGLTLLLTAGFAPQQLHYPGPVALWPVSGAALLVLSHQPGAPRPGPVTRWLGSKPLEWLGNYSYGLYLWSWPLLVAYFMLFPERGDVTIVGGVACIALAIVAAWASIRGLDLVQAWWRRNGIPRLRDATMPIAALLVPIVAVVALVIPAGQQARLQDRIEASGGLAAEPFSSVDELQAEIRESLSATSMPLLYPGFGQDGRAREWVEDDCATVTPENLDACRYVEDPSSTHEIMVIGDSQAASWLPGLRAATGGQVAIQAAGREMCPWSTVDVTTEWQGIDAQAACLEHNEWNLRLIEERRPDLVVLSFGVWHGERVVGAADAVEGMYQLADGTTELLARLAATGVPVVWLDSPPSGLNINLCGQARTPTQFGAFCHVPVLFEQLVRVSLLTDAAERAGIRFIPTLTWFCEEQSLECPAFLRGMAVQADGSHLTWGMSQALAPLLVSELHLDEIPRGPRE